MNDFDKVMAELNKAWPIGTRVRYVGKSDMFKGCEGIVSGHYPGFDENLARDKSIDSIRVECDKKSEYWPYSHNAFAPSVLDVAML